MKAKLNYRTKRILILSAIIIALLAVASASVTYFLKGNNKAQAVTGNDIENQNSSTVSTIEGSDGVNNQENDGDTNNTNNQDGTAQNTGRNNAGTTAIVTNADTNATEAIDYEEIERLIAEKKLLGWTTDDIRLNSLIANLRINKYKLSVKNVVTSKPESEDGKYKYNEEVTYKVIVSNNENSTIEKISLKDTINGKDKDVKVNRVDENGKVIEENIDLNEYTFDLNEKEEAYFEFTHVVDEDDAEKEKGSTYF